MNPAIETKELCYAYEDGTTALDHITLSAGRGRITGILGANGAGKSTLFLNLNGVLTPKEGAVTVNGRRAVYDRKGIREVRRQVGIVFQDPDDQLFSADVYRDISFGGVNLGLEPEEGRILTVCGMAAAFSALFGTPLTAAVFALEVVHVGVIQYAALVPALLSSLVGFLLAGWLRVPPTAYTVSGLAALSPLSLLQMVVVGALCAVLAVFFCAVTHGAGHVYAKVLPDPRLRALVGGALVLLLSLLDGGLSHQYYNGAGGNLVEAAVTAGGMGVEPWAFLAKLLFTAVTLGAGFRGGEIVPTFACGATFGCVTAPFLGLSPSFGGAVGMVATFCGVTNCPLSSILLAYELFGGDGLPLYALAIAVAYRLSGYSGLYSEQQIIYSKRVPREIDRKAE